MSLQLTQNDDRCLETGRKHNPGNDDQEGNDDEGPPSFEKVLEYLGVPGKFQLIQITLAQLSLFICPFMILSIVFVGFVPNHRCREVNETQLVNQYLLKINESDAATSAHVSYEPCGIRVTIPLNQSITPLEKNDQIKVKTYSTACPNGRDFFDAKDTTYASEWDLVCESKGQSELTQTIFTIGQVIGGLSTSPITDYFGRKPVVVASTCLCCLNEIVHIFSPNIYIVYVVELLGGLLFQATITSVYIICVELVVPRHRQTFSVIAMAIWDVFILIVGGVAYFVQDKNWRYFHAASFALSPICFLTPFILKESPRWLAANGRYEKALDIIKHACKTNGKDFEIAKQKFNAFVSYKYYQGHHLDNNAVPPVNGYNAIKSETELRKGGNGSSMPEITSDHPTSATKIVTHTSSPMDLLRNKPLLILLAAVWYLWFTSLLIYYGLFISSSVLAGNRFLNFVLMSLVEFPGLIVALYLMNKIGRRSVLAILVGSTGACLMVSVLMTTIADALPGSDVTNTVMFIFGSFSISASIAVLYVITPELFPTNMRTTTHGYCSALGRLGSMIAPYMRLFYFEVKWGPSLLFTLMCCLAVVVTLFLPETKGRDLPSTLEDVVNHGKGTFNIHSWKKRKEYDRLEN